MNERGKGENEKKLQPRQFHHSFFLPPFFLNTKLAFATEAHMYNNYYNTLLLCQAFQWLVSRNAILTSETKMFLHFFLSLLLFPTKEKRPLP